MKKLMMMAVAGVAMAVCAEQNEVSRQIAATYAGKTAIITGAASGMGLCTAKTLAAAGATVFMVDINGEGVRKAAKEINELKQGKAYAVEADVRKYADDERAAKLASGSMTVDSVFDLASVGKTQTAALCARLVADGKLDPDAPFTDYVTEHVLAKENCKITVRDLATHSGGFDNAKPYMTPDPKAYFEKLYAKRPVRARGEKFEYACSNYVYLGLIVEKLTGLDLDAAAKKILWGPLGMTRTTWDKVVGNPDAVEYVPSTYQGPVRKIGEHNDICAHYASRPMGNGSCFSTAPDMLKFCEDLLSRTKFPKEYYDLLFTPCFDKGGHRRSFGWEMTAADSTFSVWAPTRFSDAAICHTGWTGPAIAVDPKRDFAGVVLASQQAGKAKTMGPRMAMLEMMAG